MATPAQIQANQLNAQKSTGPTSVEGKAATRFNALQHGADAKSLLLPGEDPELLAQLASQYYEEYKPQGPEQESLVDTVVQADWNMRRFARLETQLLNALIAAQEPSAYPLGAAYLADARKGGALQKIFRRQQAARRDWYKARAELRLLQSVGQASRPVQPVARPVSHSNPYTPAPRPTPNPGKNWVGSEPPEWRL